MRRLKYVAAVCAALIAMPSFASAYYCPPHVVAPAVVTTSSAAGVAATGGFLGVVAVLVGYDLIRGRPAAVIFWASAAQDSPKKCRTAML